MYAPALSQLGLRSFHTTKTCIGVRQSIVRIHNQRCNNVDFLPLTVPSTGIHVDFLPLTVPSTGIPDALVPANFFFACRLAARYRDIAILPIANMPYRYIATSVTAAPPPRPWQYDGAAPPRFC
jgi:hypothetical protein